MQQGGLRILSGQNHRVSGAGGLTPRRQRQTRQEVAPEHGVISIRHFSTKAVVQISVPAVSSPVYASA